MVFSHACIELAGVLNKLSFVHIVRAASQVLIELSLHVCRSRRIPRLLHTGCKQVVDLIFLPLTGHLHTESAAHRYTGNGSVVPAQRIGGDITRFSLRGMAAAIRFVDVERIVAV